MCIRDRVRDVPHDVERHTLVEIIAHIGHTEEMYQMVLAVINQRNNDPVSYTHLDVYKRQVYHTPNRY